MFWSGADVHPSGDLINLCENIPEAAITFRQNGGATTPDISADCDGTNFPRC